MCSRTRSGRVALIAAVILALALGLMLWSRNTLRTRFSGSPARSIALPTIPNPGKPAGPAPPGMVWIPGGQFSMGAEDPREMLCGGSDPMPDARPIARVYVDGFWMDTTEVTNEELSALAAKENLPPAAIISVSVVCGRRHGETNLVGDGAVFYSRWRSCSRDERTTTVMTATVPTRATNPSEVL